MKKVLTNLAFIIVAIASLNAQADFRRGYIVKQNGDTLHGYINFQKEAANNSICNFKRFEIAVPVSYSPEKLKAYGINDGKQYVTIFYNGKPVFAEYLVKGKISLLYLKKGSEHYFSQVQGKPPVELFSGKTYDPLNNQHFNNYKEYLKTLFSPIELAGIEESKLTIQSLTVLVKNYNELSKVHYEVPSRPQEKNLVKDYNILGTNSVKIGILGGVNSFFFVPKTYEGAYSFMANAKFNPVINPIGGLFVKSNFSKRSALSYQIDFLYQEISLYGFSKDAVPYRSVLIFDDIFIKAEELRCLFKLNYGFIKNDFIFAPHVGVGYYYRLNPVYKRFREEYHQKNNIVKTYDFSNLAVLDQEVTLVGGLTVEYQLSSARSLILNLDYEYGNNILATQKIPGDVTTGLKGGGSGILVTLGISI